MELKPVSTDRPPRLRDDDAAPPRGCPTGKQLEKAIEKQTERVKELQKVFYADSRFALLIVLQGRDASGKDGVVKTVIGAVNPMGCEITSFKVPSEEEKQHDFLWRIHKRVPQRGVIGVFNRSHYEDVLVVRVNGVVPKKVWSSRYEQINEFERILSMNRVVILKFMLHVSRDEQKKRFEDRLADKTKNWKFREGDLADRANWEEFTKAYRDAVTKCSTPWAPWYVVPADDNDVRDLLVARAIADRMESLRLRFPKAEQGAHKLRIK